MISPPIEVAPPDRYLVLEITSISTPSLCELNSVKGMRVVSAMSGIPCLWAINANACKSTTSICGLVMISK